MRIEIAEKMRTWNLKIFLSVSLGIHLLFLSFFTLLFPGFKIDRLPPLHIEVSLLLPTLSVAAEEKSHLKRISPPKTEMKEKDKESSQPSTQNVAMHIPLEESRPLLPEDGKWEIASKKEEKVEKEPVSMVKAPLLPSDLDWNIWSEEKPFHSKEPFSKGEDLSVFLTPSHSEKLKGTPPYDIGDQVGSRIVAKLNPPSDESTVFIQPRYAENPKPAYPQEARKKGYEGEVLLEVEVLANGQVGRVEVKKSSGYEILDRSALTAVKGWKFIPANKGDGSIPCWVNIPIKFQLQ